MLRSQLNIIYKNFSIIRLKLICLPHVVIIGVIFAQNRFSFDIVGPLQYISIEKVNTFLP